MEIDLNNALLRIRGIGDLAAFAASKRFAALTAPGNVPVRNLDGDFPLLRSKRKRA